MKPKKYKEHNEKGPGFEYWSARPFNKGGGCWSPNGNSFTKRRTHKAERQLGRVDPEDYLVVDDVDEITSDDQYRSYVREIDLLWDAALDKRNDTRLDKLINVVGVWESDHYPDIYEFTD